MYIINYCRVKFHIFICRGKFHIYAKGGWNLLLQVRTNKTYLENISILSLDIVKCHDIYYNQSDKTILPEFIKWGTFIYNRDYNKIPSIIKGLISKEEEIRIMSKIKGLVDDSLFMSELEQEEWAEWEENSKLDYAQSKGFNQGIEKKTKDVILSMLENNATLEFISKVTNKTIEEINEIIKEQQ